MERYEGSDRHGRIETLPMCVCGMGLGVPLVPEVWKMCDTVSGSVVISLDVGSAGGADDNIGSWTNVVAESINLTDCARSAYFV